MIFRLFISLLFAFVISSDAFGQSCASSYLGVVRIASNNILFVPEPVQKGLSEEGYVRARQQFETKSVAEIARWLQEQSLIRSVSPEEYVAALDAITPRSPSLFRLLNNAARLKIDVKSLENLPTELTLYRQFAHHASELRGPAEQLSPAEQAILNIALRFHEISKSALAARGFLLKPIPSTNDIFEADSFLAQTFRTLGETAPELGYNTPHRKLRNLPVIRELTYFLGLRFANPIQNHQPTLRDLETAAYNPEQFKRQLFWRLGPSLAAQWVHVHLRVAVVVIMALSMPTHFANAREMVRNFDGLKSLLSGALTEETQSVIQNNYSDALVQNYRDAITEAQTEHSQLKAAGRAEDAQKIKDLENRISFFEQTIVTLTHSRGGI